MINVVLLNQKLLHSFSSGEDNVDSSRKPAVDNSNNNSNLVNLPVTREDKFKMAFTQAYGISLMTAYTGPDKLSHCTVNDNRIKLSWLVTIVHLVVSLI
jgi:hypothetical protein